MQILDVVVGLVFNEKNDILIALRPPHAIEPNVWEFPGGKVEANETLENALIREFREEIGIEITDATFFLKIEKPMPEKNILLVLHTFRVVQFNGMPRGCEGQAIAWVPVDTLKNYAFPDANAQIVRSIQLL